MVNFFLNYFFRKQKLLTLFIMATVTRKKTNDYFWEVDISKLIKI